MEIQGDVPKKITGGTGRAKNPVPPSKHNKMTKAVELFKQFTGMNPENIDRVNVPPVDVGLKIGKCDGILYTTVRDGVTEKYIHEFKKAARPVLVSSFDGKQLLLVGGRFSFTDAGIVDR